MGRTALALDAAGGVAGNDPPRTLPGSHRHRHALLTRVHLALDLLLLLPVPGSVTAGVTAGFLLVVTSLPSTAAPLLALAALLVAASLVGTLFLLPDQGSSAMPFGPETPPGPRREIAGLAQLPGTRLTAVQTARRVLATVPAPGAVVAAAADTPTQFRQYQQLGLRSTVHPTVQRGTLAAAG